MPLPNTIRTARAIAFGKPFVLFHKPTARCECRCKFCDFWVNQPRSDDAQPTAVVHELLSRAASAGMSIYTVWGGEPLLVHALDDWLAHARRVGMKTVVCTAANSLAERASQIGPHLDSLLVSLEAVGKAHDEIRRTPGLFDRLVEGLRAMRRCSSAQITIWSNLTRDNADQVSEIARFATDQRVSVEFFPAARYPGYNESMVLDGREREQVFSKIMELKRTGSPVLTSTYALDLMRTGRAFQCNIPRYSVLVTSDGTVHACEPRIVPEMAAYGNTADLDMRKLTRSAQFRETCFDLKKCNRCLLPCVAAMADGIVAQSLRRAVSLTRYG